MFETAHAKSTARLLFCAVILLGASMRDFQVQAQPSKKPLLASQSNVKPNLMITLDNSGSMAFSYHETYGVVDDTNDELTIYKCPDNEWSLFSGDWVQGGIAGFSTVNSCINHERTQYTSHATPVQITGSWSAQRSADVNPVYYNPRTTYRPRLDANGQPLVANDGITWVSNQGTTTMQYTVYKNNADQIIAKHSMFADSKSDLPVGYSRVYGFAFPWKIPEHIAYTSTNSSTPGFTYAFCTKVITVAGLQVGCDKGAWTGVTIFHKGTSDVTLPKGHNRTDCGVTSTTCSHEKEVDNILNWYRYYAFRAPAVATAIGQAVSNDAFYDLLRIGYLSINRRNGLTVGAVDQTPGIDTGNNAVLRGVRLHSKGSPDTQRFYTWLYDQDGTANRTSDDGKDPSFNSATQRRDAPYGGTPLHNAMTKVADYLSVGTNAKENPWATDPSQLASSSNPEKSCRRSFNLMFSDGAWNTGSSTIAGIDYDNTDGPSFTRTLSNGLTDSFVYRRAGLDSPETRRAYTPFPSTGTGGLADLSAKYFWHTDLRTDLANEATTRAGQPTFWQNMTTYTVGYLIRPTGEIPGKNGLTFGQIKAYEAGYASDGYEKAPKPAWADGDISAAASDQTRVDDFIQAGYTGGGRGFSARTADDVRTIFDTIISEILNAMGRDAGVAVGSKEATGDEGPLKYSVSYRTLDNSGDLMAQELDANGNVKKTPWKAADLIKEHGDRKVFTMSGNTSATNFSGPLSQLPADVQAALKPASAADVERIPSDSRFVDYLRGKDPVTDNNGALFRQRSSKIGAIVNAPPLFMGDRRDFAYDLYSTVSGKEKYEAFVKAKRAMPASIFAATNAGVMHALNAKNGEELAAFMPRGSLRRMLDYARTNYSFDYTLDGPLSEHDIYDSENWNHVAMGSGGRGEKLLYAVRSPLNASIQPNRTPEQRDFLWESGPELIDDDPLTNGVTMGYITNPIRSGQTANGEWIAVVNSGHLNGNVDGSRHGLVILNAMTGAKIRNIPLPKGFLPKDSSTTGYTTGLGGVTLMRNAQGRIVAAYAGDANGNLWRFDLKGAPSTWAVSYGAPLFTTADNRPIYGAPAWQPHPKGGAIVVVATGMLLSDEDLKNTLANEAIYGIWDPTPIGGENVKEFKTATVEQLLAQTVLTDTANVVGSNTYYAASKNTIDWKVHRGWTMPLGREHTGERSLDQIQNLSNIVLVPTTVITAPSSSAEDTCTASPIPPNYIYALKALDGSSVRFFVNRRNDQTEYASVVFVGEGGFARGMAVVQDDERAPVTSSKRLTYAPAENDGESIPSQDGILNKKCRPQRARLTGTDDESLDGNLQCSVAGWSRTQYQLSRPPAN
ncbi:pilus assembly protein [Hydrogenophaga sp. BPS33]|uniref:pilus assembly protein n=1 Tax=Hydrogenophaga sp. BPS33 TaxID=2651974 RepID=UPI0013202B1E|nr:PilC/PilY family type IV pilus protein [Hydrogenophaga sp. BPS33]QHE86832.1 hypothetical protein F9K07_18980 [Hydrogenophaga sp. BPS33]